MFEYFVVFLQAALMLWIAGLVALFLVSLFRSKVRGRGLLLNPKLGTLDPERIALLFVTIGGAIYYITTCIGLSKNDLPVIDGKLYMPDFPEELLFLLFGAQGGYISGKVIRIQMKGHKVDGS